MGDAKKVAFLAGLLRDFRLAASRLDVHLVDYSAAVHATVSRLRSPTSPEASAEHLWIRVHDRLGFFHDDDPHAKRLINIGMAYAYRHLEMDSMAVANARIINDLERGARSGAHLVESAGQAQPGGVLDAPVPPLGGQGAYPIRPSATQGSIGGSTGASLSAGTPLVGVLLDGVHPSLHARSPSGPGVVDDGPAEAKSGPQWSSSQATQRHEVVMERQPLLLPTPAAIAAVSAVLVRFQHAKTQVARPRRYCSTLCCCLDGNAPSELPKCRAHASNLRRTGAGRPLRRAFRSGGQCGMPRVAPHAGRYQELRASCAIRAEWRRALAGATPWT